MEPRTGTGMSGYNNNIPGRDCVTKPESFSEGSLDPVTDYGVSNFFGHNKTDSPRTLDGSGKDYQLATNYLNLRIKDATVIHAFQDAVMFWETQTPVLV